MIERKKKKSGRKKKWKRKRERKKENVRETVRERKRGREKKNEKEIKRDGESERVCVCVLDRKSLTVVKNLSKISQQGIFASPLGIPSFSEFHPQPCG